MYDLILTKLRKNYQISRLFQIESKVPSQTERPKLQLHFLSPINFITETWQTKGTDSGQTVNPYAPYVTSYDKSRMNKSQMR